MAAVTATKTATAKVTSTVVTNTVKGGAATNSSASTGTSSGLSTSLLVAAGVLTAGAFPAIYTLWRRRKQEKAAEPQAPISNAPEHVRSQVGEEVKPGPVTIVLGWLNSAVEKAMFLVWNPIVFVGVIVFGALSNVPGIKKLAKPAHDLVTAPQRLFYDKKVGEAHHALSDIGNNAAKYTESKLGKGVVSNAIHNASSGVVTVGERVGTHSTSFFKAIANGLERALSALGLGKNKHAGRVVESLHNAPSAISQTTVHDLGWGAVTYVGSGVQFANVGLKTESHISSLIGLYCDLTGRNRRELSFFDIPKILFSSNVPDEVKMARKGMLLQDGVGIVVATLSLFAGHYMVKNQSGGSMLKAIGLQMGTQMLGSVADGLTANHILNSYPEIARAYNKTGHISVEQYAEVITKAYSKARNTALKDTLVMGLAQEYAAAKASPVFVVQEIENGKIDARSARIDAAQKAQAAQYKTPEVAIEPKTPPAVVGKHTNDLINGAVKQHSAAHKPVGLHTGKIAAETKPALALGAAGGG